MDEGIASRLLESIEADRLTILCGAGLSMSAPSLVPSAAHLAQTCSDKYRTIMGGSELPEEIKTDLERIADFFYKRGNFANFFIDRLIPWDYFRDKPNSGHYAIADCLACAIVDFAVTTNLDTLIEDAAKELGERDFYAALDGEEANSSRTHRALLKIHGCCSRDRANTLWCREQLNSDPLRAKIETSKRWLQGHYLGRDFLILGFWSDWDYLNSVLVDCLSGIEPNLIVLVDPDSSDNLKRKAPDLWGWATSERATFFHVREKGDIFLDELRQKFSLSFLNGLLYTSRPTYQNLRHTVPEALPDIYSHLSTEDLYALRRDCCGATALSIVRDKRPSDMKLLGAIVLLLIFAGATLEGPTYVLASRRIRVLHCSGKLLSEVRSAFSLEPPQPLPTDLTICVGAHNDGDVPGNVIRGEGAGNIIRPGLQGRWINHEQALAEFGVTE